MHEVIGYQPIDSDKLAISIPNLTYVGINAGCTTRQCRICCVFSPSTDQSMHQQTIHDIFQSPHKKNQLIALYFKGDSIYYLCDSSTFAEIAFDGVKNGWHIAGSTHGFLPSDDIAIETIRRLNNNYRPMAHKSIFLGFSMDPWGWIGIPEDDHVSAIKESLAALVRFDPQLDIRVHYNANDTQGIGNYDRVHEWARRLTKPYVDEKQLLFSTIYAAGRAKSIKPTPPIEPNFLMNSKSIMVNGMILDNKTQQITGNIYKY